LSKSEFSETIRVNISADSYWYHVVWQGYNSKQVQHRHNGKAKY